MSGFEIGKAIKFHNLLSFEGVPLPTHFQSSKFGKASQKIGK
jgi:hypothetical protein